MASSNGNSTGATATTTSSQKALKSSSSEENFLQVAALEERKRKRMQSNRESARRSRMRKQKHLDELAAQVGQLKRENSEILNTVNLTTERLLTVEAENSVLRAQMAELISRLDSLNEMISFISSSSAVSSAAVGFGVGEADMVFGGGGGDVFLGGGSSLWNLGYVNQPIMASAADYHHHVFGY